MTEDYTALVAELREPYDQKQSRRPDVELKAADAIASLERQIAELPSQALWDESRKALASMRNENGELSHRATTAEAERDQLAARCGDAETLLRAFLNAEYESKSYLFDCVDKTGRPYQSQWLADRIAETERFLATGTRAALQEPQI